jgi:transposase-like protein
MRKRFTNQFKAEVTLDLLRGDKTIGQIASVLPLAAVALLP